MDAIRLQQMSHRLYKKHIPVFPGLIKKWIHFRYNSDLSPVTEVGGGYKIRSWRYRRGRE